MFRAIMEGITHEMRLNKGMLDESGISINGLRAILPITPSHVKIFIQGTSNTILNKIVPK